jgi:hypothetical protein
MHLLLHDGYHEVNVYKIHTDRSHLSTAYVYPSMEGLSVPDLNGMSAMVQCLSTWLPISTAKL